MGQDFSEMISNKEWILANGLGGYALGFINLINKRKYDGLLIASSPELKRSHILASIEERLEANGAFFYTDSSHYPNCIYPDGYRHIVSAWTRPYPSVLYSSTPVNRDYLLLKEIFMLQGKNAVAVKYSNIGKASFNLILRPKFSMRDHHALNSRGTFDHAGVECKIAPQSFEIKRSDNGLQAWGYIEDAEVIEERIVYNSIYYPMEALRGYDAGEDLISPVRCMVSLPADKSVFAVFSAEMLPPLTPPYKGGEPLKETEKFYGGFPLPYGHPSRSTLKDLIGRKDDGYIFSKKDYLKILKMAANDFLTADDIVAGYPWFGSWGRDTLISLGGLKYMDNGNALAKKILHKYGSKINGGLIPNTFGEGDTGRNYDTVDAPLWFVIRCFEFAPKDSVLLGYCSNIVTNYMARNDLPFFMDLDGLIDIREGRQALTWMDAKVYDNPVTPRFGKPVEIGALWYNAISAIIEMAKMQEIPAIKFGDYSFTVGQMQELKERVEVSLKKFVGERYLADRIESGEPVFEIRPNAITALSLPFDFIDHETMRRTWTTAKELLLNNFGLRTLDPQNPSYKAKYVGNEKQRDMSYHQGTTWTYLLLPFAKLTQKIMCEVGDNDGLKKELTSLVWFFREGFMKGNFASVAEIWDGTDPSLPRGCPAQAWSVFAILEIEEILKDLCGDTK